MKKTKILSLVLACSLLFHTTGMEVLATSAAEPVLDEQSVEAPENVSSDEDATAETPEQPAEETDQDSEEEQSPEQPSESEEGKGEETSGETGDPEVPSDEAGETEEPSDETEEPSDETEEPSDETEEPSDETEEPDADDISDEDGVSDSEEAISDNSISENTLPEEDLEQEDSEEDAFAIFPGLGDNYTFSSAQMADKQVLAAHVNDVVSEASIKANEFPDAEGMYELGEVVYLAEIWIATHME